MTKYNDDNDDNEVNHVATIRKNIFLFGEINVESTGNLLVAFQEADAKPGNIKLNICSAGGWVEGGLCMYDLIRSTNNKVITIACGAVYSSALLPFQAGDLRVMQKSARLFLHDMSLSIGQASLNTVKSVSNETSRLYKLYCENIAERSGLSFNVVDKMCKGETYLSSEECLKMGLCDLIISYKNKEPKQQALKGKKK